MKVSSLARYGASNCPYELSLFSSIAPTSMGIIFISRLESQIVDCECTDNDALPRRHTPRRPFGHRANAFQCCVRLHPFVDSCSENGLFSVIPRSLDDSQVNIGGERTKLVRNVYFLYLLADCQWGFRTLRIETKHSRQGRYDVRDPR